ncbi:MAG: hypothetical protein V1704_02160 [Candidatus Vogelbacteria bacterium]
MIKLGQKIIAFLTITALILPAATLVVFLTPSASAQKSSAQRLAETRKDDQRQCESEISGGTPTFGQAVAGAVTKPLKDAVGEEAGKAMPKAVNDAIANRIPAGIEQGIKKELPNIISEGLKRELPATLGEQIRAEMARRDQTFKEYRDSPDFKGSFTGLIRASIDETLPRIVQDGLHDRLPNIIDTSIKVELPNSLRLEFNKIAQPTIRDHFAVQINTMIGQIPQMIADAIKSLRDTIQATIDGLRAAMRSLAQKKPIDWAFDLITAVWTWLETGDSNASLDAIPEFSQIMGLIENLGQQIKATEEFVKWATELLDNKEKLVDNLVDGFAVELSKSLTEPKNIARLADAIGSAMTDPINRSLDNALGNIEDAINGPINRAIAGINDLPNQFFGEINGALDNVADLVNLQIETVVHAVTNPIVSTIDVLGDKIATTIDTGLNSVMAPIVGGTGEFLGSVGHDIAMSMNTAALQTHMNIFGSEGLFVDETVGTELWPTHTYESGVMVSGPPTYFPAPGDAGFVEPVLTGPEVGPPGPGGIPPPDLTPVGPLTDATEELATGASDATIASTETVVGDAVAETAGPTSLTGMAAGLIPGAISGMSGLLSGFLKTGNPIIDALAQAAFKKVFDAAATAAGFATGATLAVPVSEIGALLMTAQSTDSTTGKILQTQQEIKAMTEKLLSLQIQACTHLKVVQRVQLALEEKELLNDPNARKNNADTIYKYQIKFAEFLNQGRQLSELETGVADPGNENKGSLVVANLTESIAKAGEEAKSVALDQLTTLAEGENYSDLKIINASLALEGNINELADTVPKEQMDKFRSNDPSQTNEEFWNTFTELGKNNIYTKKLKADQIIAQRVADAQNSTQAEYEAGGGYFGTRECIATSASGGCAEWRILTPSGTIRDMAGAVVASPLHQVETSDENIEDFMKNEVGLNTNRLANLSNVSETVPTFEESADQSVFTQPDPCPGPGPCSQTGWPRQTTQAGSGGGLGSFASLPSSSGGGGGSNIASLPDGKAGQSPSVIVSIKTPTIAEININQQTRNLAALGVVQTSGNVVKNETTLSWTANDADTCLTTNDWVSGQVGKVDNNAKMAGTNIGTSGIVAITHPINFRAVAPIFSQTVAGGIAKPILTPPTITSDKLKYQLTFNPLNGSGIHAGDIYQLAVAPNLTLTVGPVTLKADGNPPTAADVITLFKTGIQTAQVGNTPLGRELDRYSFAYLSGKIMMSPSLTYELTCTKGVESRDASYTITRQP